MCKEHQVSISSPFEALAVPVIFFIKCEVFFFLFFLFFFSCVKKINDNNENFLPTTDAFNY